LQCAASDSKRDSTAFKAFNCDQNLTLSSVELCALLQRWASEALFKSTSVNSVTATVASPQTSNSQATTHIASAAENKALLPNLSKSNDDNYRLGMFANSDCTSFVLSCAIRCTEPLVECVFANFCALQTPAPVFGLPESASILKVPGLIIAHPDYKLSVRNYENIRFHIRISLSFDGCRLASAEQ
jgi:hypothetical protein